jgi:hypothetical protein
MAYISGHIAEPLLHHSYKNTHIGEMPRHFLYDQVLLRTNDSGETACHISQSIPYRCM